MGERGEDDMRDDRIKESGEKETGQGMRPKAAFGIYTTLNRLAKKRPMSIKDPKCISWRNAREGCYGKVRDVMYWKSVAF